MRESRYPDLFGEEPPRTRASPDPEPVEPERRGARGHHARGRSRTTLPWSRHPCPTDTVQEPLTPMGNRRSGGDRGRRPRLRRCPSRRSSSTRTARPKPKTGADERVGAQLVEALGHFGVEAQVVGSVSGPHVTRYELRLAPGIKMSKVADMRDDLAYALAADDVRILAPDPRQARGGRRGAEPAAPDGAPGRRGPGGARGLVAAHRVARQGHRRQGDRHRPRRAAARAGCRHHRLGQVGLRERDARLDPHARHAERGADGARRPQAGGAQPLRAHPAPADAGGHEPAAGRQRAPEPDPRDGGALLADVSGAHAQAGGAEPASASATASGRCRTSSA